MPFRFEPRTPDGVHVNGHTLTMKEVYNELKAAGKNPRVMYEYHAPQTKPLGQGGDMRRVQVGWREEAAQLGHPRGGDAALIPGT